MTRYRGGDKTQNQVFFLSHLLFFLSAIILLLGYAA